MQYPVGRRHWKRAEYDRLIDLGVLDEDDPIELLGGELVVREPQGSSHHSAIGLTEDALRAALAPGWLVRSQGPVALAAATSVTLLIASSAPIAVSDLLP